MKLLLSLCFSFILLNANAQNTFPATGSVGIGTTSSLTHPLTIKPSVDGKGLLILPPASNPNTDIFLQFATHPFYQWIYEIKTKKRMDFISDDQIFFHARDIFFDGNAVVTRNDSNSPTSIATSKSSGTMPFETNLYSTTLGAGVITYAGLQNVASTTLMGGHRLAFKMAATRSDLTDGKEFMAIFSDSTVGIGTTDTKHYKLAVNGPAIFTKVVVQNYATWADYVFQKSYKLPTLEEVEKYIQSNQHLPEIPTTAEVKQNGIDLGDTQALLLKKVEELTLYLIEQNKQIKEQAKEIRKQHQQIDKLTRQAKK